MSVRRLLLLCAILVPGAGCGYHVGGTADLIPKNIKTIAVPPFTNTTSRYKLTDKLPNTIAREFISRTRYEVIQDVTQADAVLNGAVNNVLIVPMTLDPATNRAAGLEVQVFLAITLRDRLSGKLLFDRPLYVFRKRYEISNDPEVYFDESSMAFERLSRDVARSVVSGVLENF